MLQLFSNVRGRFVGIRDSVAVPRTKAHCPKCSKSGSVFESRSASVAFGPSDSLRT